MIKLACASCAYWHKIVFQRLCVSWQLFASAITNLTSSSFTSLFCEATCMHIIHFVSTITSFFKIRFEAGMWVVHTTESSFRLNRLWHCTRVLCEKIFGPGKKLGSLVLFTMCLLIITSCVSLQLFCSIENFEKFATFPQVCYLMLEMIRCSHNIILQAVGQVVTYLCYLCLIYTFVDQYFFSYAVICEVVVASFSLWRSMFE